MKRVTALNALGLLASCLFASESIGAPTPTPSPQPGPMVIITPEGGVANQFELLRVREDGVEVRRDGIRLQFARDQIKQVRIPDADAVIDQAEKTLELAQDETLENFHEVLPLLESQLAGIKNIVQRFGWLVVGASESYVSAEQTIRDVRNTIEASKSLEDTTRRIEQMAVGTIPLDASWEAVIEAAIEETTRIPYMGIRRDAVNKILGFRREIRLDLAKSVEEASQRVQSIREDLLSEIETGTLTEARALLLVGEMRRHAERIPDPRSKQEELDSISGFEATLRDQVARIATRSQFQRIARDLSKIEGSIEAATTTQAVEALTRLVEGAKDLTAPLVESSTGEQLAAQILALESKLKAATAAIRPASPEVAAPVGPEEVEAPSDLSAKAGSLIHQIRESVSGLAIGIGVGAFIAVLLLVLIIKRVKRPKPATAAGGVIFADSGMERKTEDDPFGFAHAAHPSPAMVGHKPKAAPGVPVDPSPPVPGSTEDVFGFSPTPTLPPVDDPFAGVEIPSLPAQEPEAEGQPSVPSKEEDVFGFSAPAPVASPPSASEPIPELALPPQASPADTGDDVFGFAANPPPPAPEPPPAPAPIVPEAPLPEPIKETPPEDPFTPEATMEIPPAWLTNAPQDLAPSLVDDDEPDDEDPFGLIGMEDDPDPLSEDPPPPHGNGEEVESDDDPFGFLGTDDESEDRK